MAAGAPVVATAVSGIPELVEHEVNGLLVAPDDPEALADALAAPARATPSWPTGSPRTAARPSRERFDGERLAQRARRAVPGGGGAVIVLTAARPRPVFCVNEHEHRDRALADAVAAGRFTLRRRDARARARARLAGRRPARGRGVADRLGQVLLRARPRRRLPRHRRRGATCEAWERLVASFVLQVPPDHDSSDVTARRILNWIYAWQRLPEADDASRRRSSRASREQARHVRDEPHRRAQPPHARALRAADRRARAARARAGLLGWLAELHDNLLTDFGARRRAPRALARTTTDRAALVRRRARELPPLRRRAARAASTSGWRARASSRALPAPRRHDPGAVGQRHRRLRASCSRSPPAARPRRPAATAAAGDFPDGGYCVQRAARPLPDLRLRPARRRRPRPLRRAQRRGVGGRARRW